MRPDEYAQHRHVPLSTRAYLPNQLGNVENAILLLASTCGQGARKSAAKTALSRAPLALTVSIDLSASDEDGGDCKGVESPRGLRPPPGKQAAPGRLRCEYEIRIQMVGRGSTLVLDDFDTILSI